MAFDEVQFPAELVAFGARGGPGHQTRVIETDSGQEERTTRWSYPKYRFGLELIERSNEQIAEIMTFAIARQGALRGFRLKHHNDFTSNADGTSDPDDEDVQIGIGDGSETQFQLIKTYTSGLSTVIRKIVKPVAGTVVIAVDGVAQTAGSDYTIDTTTGVVTFDSAPSNSAVITAGFEFDVPVRFSEDVDDWLSSSRDDVDANSLDQLEMMEIIDPVAVTPSRPYGGAVEKLIGGNIVLSLLEAAFYVVSASTTGLYVQTPSPASLGGISGELWRVANAGSNSFDVKDHLGTTLLTLAADEAAVICLSDDGAGTYVWYAF